MFKRSCMDNNSSPCLVTVPSWAPHRVIPVILSSLWGRSQNGPPAIYLNFSHSQREWHLPHGCHIWVTLSSLTYFCILSTDHCLAQLSISILGDLLCQKHSLHHAPRGQTLTLNSASAAAFASFHPSNPHDQPAFLLICPTTTHSRNTEHAVRTLLHM